MNSQTNKRTRSIFFLLLILSPILAPAQETGTKICISGYSLYSSGTDLPFWFTANQQGIFERTNKSFSIGDLSVRNNFSLEKKWDLSYGMKAIYAKGDNNYHQLNEWYAGIKYKSFYLKTGAFPEETIWGGLSSSNGNMAWSNNARPMPRIKLATSDFIPLPILKKSNFWKNVEWKAVYEEGTFDDERYVKDAHLHHKLFYLRKKFNEKERLTFGADHYVMWGGTSPDEGELPGIKSYLRYVLGLPGTSKFDLGDREYTAGNQLGRYYIEYEKSLTKGKLSYYLNHPFEDRISIGNLIDNLFGVYYKADKNSIISEVLFEYMYTNDQNRIVREDGSLAREFNEDYFRHSIYLSGFSYNNKMIASPFFEPLIISNGINLGTGNNRVSLLHFGLSGYLLSQLRWKSFFSYSRNYGTYDNAYAVVDPDFFDGTRFYQFSLYSELNWHFKSQWYLALALSSDLGKKLENKLGIMLKIDKTFSIGSGKN